MDGNLCGHLLYEHRPAVLKNMQMHFTQHLTEINSENFEEFPPFPDCASSIPLKSRDKKTALVRRGGEKGRFERADPCQEGGLQQGRECVERGADGGEKGELFKEGEQPKERGGSGNEEGKLLQQAQLHCLPD